MGEFLGYGYVFFFFKFKIKIGIRRDYYAQKKRKGLEENEGEMKRQARIRRERERLWRNCYKIATIDFNAADSTIEVQSLSKDGRPCVVPQWPSGLSVQHSEDYLVESSSEFLCIRKIYSAFFPKEVSDFEIFRVDLYKMECEALDTLGECTILLANGMSYSSIATVARTVGNNVYYTETGEKNLFLYKPEDRSKTILQPCPNEGSDWLGQCWVMMH
ncbi:hypothetical protein ACH5RR_026522 [Cinchona calisaya]|uniref:KIB1-4 beta-propeller domain-containing protein n=1 Tax=Cinchona calisaya TaxID=153742 RepID=A0ABD2Z643_9GENT